MEVQPVRSTTVSSNLPPPEPPVDPLLTGRSGEAGDGAPNYALRRVAVGGGVLAVVALVVVGIVVLAGGDDGSDRITSASTTSTKAAPADSFTAVDGRDDDPAVSAATTTTTTVPPTTTTSTTTSTTTTTTTLAPVTTLVEAGVPVWPSYELLPPLDGVAALTGQLAGPELTNRPVIAVKIDNYQRGRPQWGLDQADVIFEENVEGVTRFVAMFHTRLPDRAGPVRSARTGDIDIFSALNRPILGWSGGNAGVTAWIRSAASSGVLVDFTALRNGCYNRSSSRSVPHNLQLDPACAIENSADAGPARALWSFDDGFVPPDYYVTSPDPTFEVPMDGVRVGWTWDADAGLYRRSQDGRPHLAASGAQVSVNNVVELYATHVPSPVDARSPNPITVGWGRVVIHRNGQAIEGIWARRTAFDPFTFADMETGEHIPLGSGTTFVELTRAE